MSIIYPFSDVCIAGAIADEDVRERQKIKAILQNSIAIFGVELRPMNVQGGITNTSAVAPAYSLRTEGSSNYITCNQLEHCITLASDYADEAWDMHEACGLLSYNCRCNARWNAKAYTSILSSLESAALWDLEAEGIVNCDTLEAQAYAKELENYVQDLWVEESDVEGGNKRLIAAMVGTSALMIFSLMAITK